MNSQTNKNFELWKKILKDLHEKMDEKSKELGSCNEDVEIVKENQMESSELKNRAWYWNFTDGINSRLGVAKEGASEFEDKPEEFIQIRVH